MTIRKQNLAEHGSQEIPLRFGRLDDVDTFLFEIEDPCYPLSSDGQWSPLLDRACEVNPAQ